MTINSFYSKLQEGSMDPIMVVMQNYRNDTDPRKTDLSIGVYKPENGDVKYVFPSVKKAKKDIYENDEGHPYHDMLGLPEFTSGAHISGTGAVHMGIEFLKQINITNFYVGTPSWINYESMIKSLGCDVTFFNHYNVETKQVDIESTLSALDSMPDGSAVLLQACCHNPTGADYSKDQWKAIAEKVKARNIFTFFDIAYQGFASGSKDEDAWAVRHFYEQNLDFLVCQSFSKNMGLYGERAGCLHVVSGDKSLVPNVQTTLVSLFRQQCSFAPLFGARIASRLFTDYKQEWDEDVETVTRRLKQLRQDVAAKFRKLGTPGNWDFITLQNGLFWYSGLSAEQVERLQKDFHIYLPSNGRFNVAGLNQNNLDYVVESIHKVVAELA